MRRILLLVATAMLSASQPSAASHSAGLAAADRVEARLRSANFDRVVVIEAGSSRAVEATVPYEEVRRGCVEIVWPVALVEGPGPRPKNPPPLFTRDAGCGALTVSVDPFLESARVTGSFASRAYDAANGRTVPSRISIEANFVGTGERRVAAETSVPPPEVGTWSSVTVSRRAEASGRWVSRAMGSSRGVDQRAEMQSRLTLAGPL